MIYRPLREKPLSLLTRQADRLIRETGYDELSLSSLSTSDYGALPELMDHLMEICPARGVNISLPSLRIDAFSLRVMSKVQDIKKSSLTFAPEAGTQRMRNVINKGLSGTAAERALHSLLLPCLSPCLLLNVQMPKNLHSNLYLYRSAQAGR